MSEAHDLVLVEDDSAVRASLDALLGSWGFRITAFEDGESFLAALGAGTLPDPVGCVLLDLRLPERDGLCVLRVLRRQGFEAPVIMLSAHGDIAKAVSALKLGAQDFIEKPFDGDMLVARIRALDAGRAGPEAQARAAFARLSPREDQVMRLVVAGRSNKLIAHELGISQKTVEMHRANVMAKTGAPSLSHLVGLALRAGIDPESAG